MRVLIAGLICALFLVIAGPAHAVIRCVPQTSPSCRTNGHPTVQAAHDAARVGDTINVYAGTPPERVVIRKRVKVVGKPGHRLTDAGLPPGGDLIRVEGGNRVLLAGLVIHVVTSQVGIRLVGGFSTKIQDVVLTGVSGRGVSLDGGSRQQMNGSTIRGFAEGVLIEDVFWPKIQTNTLEGNGTGMRVLQGDGGQVFFNTFRDNGVGLVVAAAHHVDVNSNSYRENGDGLVWALGLVPNRVSGLTASAHMEINRSRWTGNDRAIVVETAPGVYSLDHRDDPGCSTDWDANRVDGAAIPSWMTADCPFDP